MEILRVYLRRYMLACGDLEGGMCKQCHRVTEIAECGSKAAEYCFSRYQIDPLLAVDADVVAAGGTHFAAKGWPITVTLIRRKLSAWQTNTSGGR